MFTGIIETLCTVREVSNRTLLLEAEHGLCDPWRVGESVAVNGCCLTVVGIEQCLKFEMSEETMRRTSLGSLEERDVVNLERAMRADGRFGGHMVQGHVDGVGALLSVERTEQAHVMRFTYPASYERYLIEKGSIAVNGISLTAVDVSDNRMPEAPNPEHLTPKASFSVWIIPHTWLHTNLSHLEVGQSVNLEFDMIAKYVESLLR